MSLFCSVFDGWWLICRPPGPIIVTHHELLMEDRIGLLPTSAPDVTSEGSDTHASPPLCKMQVLNASLNQQTISSQSYFSYAHQQITSSFSINEVCVHSFTDRNVARL